MVVFSSFKNTPFSLAHQIGDDRVLVCAGIVKETEEFIYNIWSPGKESPETFWIALKAVGSCGGRQCVSQPYFNALLQEASQYLGLLENASVGGYSRTVLVVDTVKALS